MSAPRIAQFKLVLLGESAVGKSSLLLRFARGVYEDNRESTIGAAFLAQNVRLEPDLVVRFEIWDTAGQERYKALAPMYYRNANAALVVFDLLSQESLARAQSWVRELRAQADDGIIIALVGNKLDLVNQLKAESLNSSENVGIAEDAKSYAAEAGLLYYECSAKTGENIEAVFKGVAEKMPINEYFSSQEEEQQHAVDLGASSSGCAC